MPIPQFTAGQVLTAAELNAMVDAINAGGAVKIARFTASGTWTVPTGVTYAVAHILAGGGGAGSASSGAGGNSSVAFAGGTVTATGGAGISTGTGASSITAAGRANSGQGALYISDNAGTARVQFFGSTMNGALIVAGDAVTPAASITVTVGAGGVAGTNGSAGGSGYVYIEYQGG
jgi:hypothetical protein